MREIHCWCGENLTPVATQDDRRAKWCGICGRLYVFELDELPRIHTPANHYNTLAAELGHALLTAAQGIRTADDHAAAEKAAIGDIIIFLKNFCTVRGYALDECVSETWNKAKQRNRQANPETGGEADNEQS